MKKYGAIIAIMVVFLMGVCSVAIWGSNSYNLVVYNNDLTQIKNIKDVKSLGLSDDVVVVKTESLGYLIKDFKYIQITKTE